MDVVYHIIKEESSHKHQIKYVKFEHTVNPRHNGTTYLSCITEQHCNTHTYSQTKITHTFADLSDHDMKTTPLFVLEDLTLCIYIRTYIITYSLMKIKIFYF